MKNLKDMLGRYSVVALSDAIVRLEKALCSVKPVSEEEIDIREALHRITSRHILAPENLPLLDRSTVDGYAVRAADTFGASESIPVYLEIAGEVLMGQLPMEAPPPLQCCRIPTGGYLPPGTGAVIMLEHTVKADTGLIEVTRPVAAGGNVIAAGEDVKVQDLVIPAGRHMRPQDIGLLAGIGTRRIFVRRAVKVGLFSTGDEIAPHDAPPILGKIRDMNGPMLAAMVEETGAVVSWYGIAPDLEEAFRALLARTISENDLVIFSGSSSVGSRDLGEQLISECAPPGILVHGVAIKPGKPVIIALSGSSPIFCLPGHPVSAAVTFDLFALPAIRHLSGALPSQLPSRPTLQARLMRNIHSAGGRVDFIRVQVKHTATGDVEVYPVLGKSGALSTLVKADGYLIIEENREGLLQGELVVVHLF